MVSLVFGWGRERKERDRERERKQTKKSPKEMDLSQPRPLSPSFLSPPPPPSPLNVFSFLCRSSLQSVSSETMVKLFTTNAIGPLLVAQQLERAGLVGRGSTIANMTSKMGSMADNGSGGTYAYR